MTSSFDSPAADKRIAPNTVISSINDQPVRNLSDWNEALAKLRPGDPVRLEVIPQGERPFPVFLRAPSTGN